MDGDLRVEPGLLRARAGELELVASALASVSAQVCAAADPSFVAGRALVVLSDAVSGALGSAAARVARSGGLLREAALSYEDADSRAAHRLRRVG
ncbi:hypothetical protein O7635_04695 [Asanoa sp. WMMD1127]|uniref:hypothetical protein n=1 Tax=Asanoa sp. WMMD1127 TaxID=3016107 RepID=UPI002418002A|nr:hypothetical protein [Asanoa sp. WMMD1127]MDG4821153.1 hypothetical protein [Asanoa sp. WMMD1127]